MGPGEALWRFTITVPLEEIRPRKRLKATATDLERPMRNRLPEHGWGYFRVGQPGTFVAALGDLARGAYRTQDPRLMNATLTISNVFDQLGLSDVDKVLIGPNVDDIERQLAAMAQRTALPFAVGLGHFLLEFLVFLIATFLLLRDAPRLYEFVRRNLPNRQRREIVQVLGETNVMLGRYIRGQFLLVALMSTVTTIGLTLLGVPYSVLLGRRPLCHAERAAASIASAS